MIVSEPLAITSLEHLKEATKDQATVCFMRVWLPESDGSISYKPFKHYKLIWYNKGKKEFMVTNFNPNAENVEDVTSKKVIPEDRLVIETGILQAIKRGNFYIE